MIEKFADGCVKLRQAILQIRLVLDREDVLLLVETRFDVLDAQRELRLCCFQIGREAVVHCRRPERTSPRDERRPDRADRGNEEADPAELIRSPTATVAHCASVTKR